MESVPFSDDGKDLDIFLTVNEGTQFKVGVVSWSGNELFPDSRIAPLIMFEEGDVFDDSKFTEIQIALNSVYWDRGYIYNSVSPEKSVKGDIIDLHFEITEGKPAHIHEIKIAGNTKTSENVIRRELRVHPGDVFQPLRDAYVVHGGRNGRKRAKNPLGRNANAKRRMAHGIERLRRRHAAGHPQKNARVRG